MYSIEYRKILLRFLKERSLYNRFKTKLFYFENKNKKDEFYKIFDSSFSWSNTEEGFKFWYFTQLDFIKLLITYNKDEERFKKYYKALINGYYHERYVCDEKWIEHNNFYKSLFYEN